MKAIETTGIVNDQHQLLLDRPLPISGKCKVRVIVLVSEETETTDIKEKDWLKAAASNPAFDFLKHPEENIYSHADGKPFHD